MERFPLSISAYFRALICRPARPHITADYRSAVARALARLMQFTRRYPGWTEGSPQRHQPCHGSQEKIMHKVVQQNNGEKCARGYRVLRGVVLGMATMMALPTAMADELNLL